MPQILRLLLVVVMSISLFGCAHQMTIQQGVQLQQEQINELKPGMTQAQVEYVLGTPNLIDPYHPNTWYYIYTNKINRDPMTQQKFVVYFKNNQLIKATGDFVIPANLH
jgi:outer membrane protein assembly factor BamE